MYFVCYSSFIYFFFFKQKTAYEMRISDWSSDVCSSDLARSLEPRFHVGKGEPGRLEIRDGLAELLAVPRIGDRLVKTALSAAERACAAEEPRGALTEAPQADAAGDDEKLEIGRAHV